MTVSTTQMSMEGWRALVISPKSSMAQDSYNVVVAHAQELVSLPDKPPGLTRLGSPGNGSIHLEVPYFSQHDNTSGQGHRECFSSSCAMVAAAYLPNIIPSDDEWNRRRRPHGDTTSVQAQLDTFRSIGLDARFHTNGGQEDLKRLLLAGQPVPFGWFHNGHWEAPRKDHGHWSLAVGWTDCEELIMHDPAGAMSGKEGGAYHGVASPNDHKMHYSFMEKRWEADGPRTGWFIDVRPPRESQARQFS